MGQYGVSPASSAYNADFLDQLSVNFTAAYCTPYVYTPPTITGPSFVAPKFVVKISTGSCTLNT